MRIELMSGTTIDKTHPFLFNIVAIEAVLV
jgi:hypothetical protein